MEGKVQAEEIQDSLASMQNGSQCAAYWITGGGTCRGRCGGWACGMQCDVDASIITVGFGKITSAIKCHDTNECAFWKC
jgi:hypothetical protein